MQPNRLQQKNDLFIKLGALFGPLQHLAEHSDEYDEQERAQTIARYSSKYSVLLHEFISFCEGQPGHRYVIEHVKFQGALEGVIQDLMGGHIALLVLVRNRLEQAKSAIAAVPVPRNAVILEAGTPFSTYCKLRDLCEAEATTELIWIDAYIADSIFHRYLRNVSPNVKITLVASEPRATAGKRDEQRWTAFLDISRLYAAERGPALYCLVVNQNLHDRWLLLDGKELYSLGGSAKDAGDKRYFTIAPLDCSPTNLQEIQTHIANGTEYFGPSTPNHL